MVNLFQIKKIKILLIYYLNIIKILFKYYIIIMPQTLLEVQRNGMVYNKDKIKRLLEEMCLYDSVHDFDTILYDKIPKSKSIVGYGDNYPSLLSNINFTYVCNKIFPHLSQKDTHIAAQENNKIQSSAFGVIQAHYTKSRSEAKPNIEMYYLFEAIKLKQPKIGDWIKDNSNYKLEDIQDPITISNTETDTDIYNKLAILCDTVKQFNTDATNTPYIPIVVDVQKKLLKVLRANPPASGASGAGGAGKPEIAYVLNREMTNDAAGKLNFREPIKHDNLNY